MVRGGRRGDAGWGLSKDDIKGGCVGKHGLGVKVRWYGMIFMKEGPPKSFRGVAGAPQRSLSFEIEIFSFYDKGVYGRLCEG